MALERVRPFIYQLRDGSESDPYLDKIETLKPVAGRAVTEEIPVKGFGILIDGFVEKTSNTPTGNEFYVDYSNGVLYFDKLVTKDITIRYRGRGVVRVPAERIFFGDSDSGQTMDVTLKEMHNLLSVSENATESLQQTIDDVILATSNANTASINANEKATIAQSAADRADVATTNANNAAQSASTEASNLSQLKSDVITATENANVSASNADSKATLAEQKAQLANMATENANIAASNANTKAALADEAATNAHTEGNIARTRGEFADSMAQEAQTQGLYAKTQGDFAKAEATDLQTLKDSLSLATSNANTATANANTASANADASATNADEKATLAQTKIDAMNTLSTEVTTLKGTLQTKITEANTATSEAIVATGDANVAAQYANEKGLLAQTEASNLEQMKTDVSTATIQANGAASNAQIKANLADEKAIYAQQQGDYAKSQGDAIQDILDNGNVASVNGQTGAVVLGASDVGTLTTQQINDKIRSDLDALVGASPETLNTLEELAQALGDDPNFATTVTNELGTKANQSDLNTHTSDTGKHLQTGERDSWNAKLDASDVGVPGGVASLGADGKVPASQLNVSAPADATTTVKGIVMLEDSVTSTSVTKAATPKNVKQAYDLANAAVPLTQKGVANGLATLDASGKVPVSQLNLSATATQSSNGFMSSADKTALDNAQKWKLTESNGVAMLPAAGTNFDTVIKTGIYKYASTSNHLNSPTGTGFWIVTVEDYDNGINVLQLWKSTDSNEMYMRRKDSTGWKPFRKLTDDDTLTNTILGNKITVQSNANFIGKVAGSTTANPHTLKGLSALSTTLQPPNGLFSELITENYRLISKLDGELSRDAHIGNGVIVQNLFSFNLIAHVERTYGTIPGSTISEKVAWLRMNIPNLTFKWWGFGSSAGGNKARILGWNDKVKGYFYEAIHTSSNVQVLITNTTTDTKDLFDANGFVHFLAAAEPSDGTTASVINTDYVELQVELSTDIKTNLLLASQTEKGLMSPSDKVKLDGIEAKIDGAKDELSAQIGILSDKVDDLKTVKSSKDANGIFTTITYRRKSDDSLFATSALSGGTSPNYTTRTITYYEQNGTVIRKTVTYALSYDADGALVSEV